MRNNKYTVFISPPRAGKSRHFSFHIGTFYSLILIVFILIIGNCIALLKYFETDKLTKENTKLKKENEELQKIANVMQEIEKNESFIKDFLGLEHNGTNMGGLGQGGEGLDIMGEPLTEIPDPPMLYGEAPSHANQEPLERALDLNHNLEGIIVLIRKRMS